MVKFISKKPYLVLLVFIPIFLIIGFIKPQGTLDINIHDTYFVIANLHLAFLVSFLFSVLAFVYFGLLKFNFRLIKLVTFLHVLLTIGCAILVLVCFQLFREIKTENLEAFLNDSDFNTQLNISITLLTVVFIAAQFLFLVNVIYALIKGRK